MTTAEIGEGFDLTRVLNHGYLPRMVEATAPARRLDAYVAHYLREEVAAEGLVRNLPAFSGFLNAAALCDGELINFSNMAAGGGPPRRRRGPRRFVPGLTRLECRFSLGRT